MEEDAVIKAMSALAHANRLRIFRLLVVAGGAGATPGTIADTLALPAATLSFHLKELLNAGLIGQQRQGRNLIYRADYAQMGALLAYLTDNCCQGEACDQPATLACQC
ncbi:MAG: helix-turn-helix transcriptional regulator [Rhodocyclaceae bacterium]|nr:helix-turn-helix transcriptional regulator [Rhodocyclaceae bacterium]